MKVIVTRTIRNEYGFDEEVGYTVETPKNSISIYNMNECPEDATLSRDLSDIYTVEDMIQEAYEAGKRGEEIKFEYITEE